MMTLVTVIESVQISTKQQNRRIAAGSELDRERHDLANLLHGAICPGYGEPRCLSRTPGAPDLCTLCGPLSRTGTEMILPSFMATDIRGRPEVIFTSYSPVLRPPTFNWKRAGCEETRCERYDVQEPGIEGAARSKLIAQAHDGGDLASQQGEHCQLAPVQRCPLNALSPTPVVLSTSTTPVTSPRSLRATPPAARSGRRS